MTVTPDTRLLRRAARMIRQLRALEHALAVNDLDGARAVAASVDPLECKETSGLIDLWCDITDFRFHGRDHGHARAARPDNRYAQGAGRGTWQGAA